ERCGGDVDRDVRRGPQRPDQQARLEALAAAILDEDAAPAREPRDLGEVLAGERELGARGVVLGQAADALEQAAAGRVIEILGGKRLLRPRQPREDVLQEA